MIRGLAIVAVLCSGVAAAQPYVRTRVPDKNLCLFWPERKYVYSVDQAGNPATPGTTELGAIDAAFGTWSALSSTCSDFQVSKGVPAAAPLVEYRQGATNNQNVVMFRDKSCADIAAESDPCWNDNTCGNTYRCWDNGDATIALTTTTFSFRTGNIFDADIELNGAPHTGGGSYLFTTVNSPPCRPEAVATTCVATDVQNTMTHEIGHVMGLDHSGDEGSTMEATAPVGETRKRVIDQGTASGFCTIYPRGAPTPPCDGTGVSVKRIVADNRGTPGFQAIGCTAGGGAPLGFAALAILLARRRSRSRSR